MNLGHGVLPHYMSQFQFAQGASCTLPAALNSEAGLMIATVKQRLIVSIFKLISSRNPSDLASSGLVQL